MGNGNSSFLSGHRVVLESHTMERHWELLRGREVKQARTLAERLSELGRNPRGGPLNVENARTILAEIDAGRRKNADLLYGNDVVTRVEKLRSEILPSGIPAAGAPENNGKPTGDGVAPGLNQGAVGDAAFVSPPANVKPEEWPDAEIIGFLDSVAAAQKIKKYGAIRDACRRHGIDECWYYKWLKRRKAIESRIESSRMAANAVLADRAAPHADAIPPTIMADVLEVLKAELPRLEAFAAQSGRDDIRGLVAQLRHCLAQTVEAAPHHPPASPVPRDDTRSAAVGPSAAESIAAVEAPRTDTQVQPKAVAQVANRTVMRTKVSIESIDSILKRICDDVCRMSTLISFRDLLMLARSLAAENPAMHHQEQHEDPYGFIARDVRDKLERTVKQANRVAMLYGAEGCLLEGDMDDFEVFLGKKAFYVTNSADPRRYGPQATLALNRRAQESHGHEKEDWDYDNLIEGMIIEHVPTALDVVRSMVIPKSTPIIPLLEFAVIKMAWEARNFNPGSQISLDSIIRKSVPQKVRFHLRQGNRQV